MVHFTTEWRSTQYRESSTRSIPWSFPLHTGNPVGIGFNAWLGECGLSSCQTSDGKKVWGDLSKGLEGRVTGPCFPGISLERYPRIAVLLPAEAHRRITTG